MESTEITVRQRTTGQDENQRVNQEKLGSSKPLHRFVQRDPRSHGVVLIIFGCAEVLMGFQVATDEISASFEIYIPFWQGALFLVCGILSVYTAIHPSKKMVTVCLAMYVVSLLGIIVSVCYRIYSISHLAFLGYRNYMYRHERVIACELLCIEVILFTSSLCVSGLLIFLSTIARLALKSTRSQIIVQCVPAAPPPPQSDTTAN